LAFTAFGSALAAMAVGTILSGVSAQLFGPKMPKAQASRLNPTFEPQAHRKFVFGQTAMNSDVRYYETSGTDQEYFDYIIATSAHEVESIDEIWFDDEIAWSSGSGVASKYTGYLTVDTRTVGTSANTIAINGGAIWGSSCRLTGCSYVYLRLKRTGNDKKADSPLVNGLPSRVTIKGKGAKIYDPRLDSTVVGGSGTHRANDQTTWGTANSTNRDNPALQLLWFLLGWNINGKLSVGCGVPYQRIDLPSFITAANICDEAITLAAGGTQPRYRTAGVGSDADNRMEIIQLLLGSMNATLRDSNGKLSLTVMKNDLATPVLTFDDDDILGEFAWNQTRGLDEMVNAVHGKYTDPSNNSLYQPVEYPTISITSIDGIERMQTFDMPWVQEGRRAQRIAKQVLQRAQYKGVFSATFTMKALGCEVGDIVYITFSSLGWTNKPFRILSQGINNTGAVPMTMIEENAAIYAWDSSETATVTPTSPTVYDPLNDPVILGINELADNKFITINADRLTFTFDGAGSLDPTPQSSTITATPNNLTQGNVVWSYTDNLGTASATLAALVTVVSANEITVPSTMFTGTPTRTWLKATVAGQGTESTIAANVTIVKVVDGAQGSDGLTAYLTNEAILLFAYADGTVSSYTPATGDFKVFDGNTDVSSSFTLSTVTNPQTLSMVYTGQTYSVTGGFDANEDTASVTIRATGSGSYSGAVFDKTLSLSKAKGGYEIVSTLPSTNLFEGRVVFLTTDDKLYRYTGSAWTAAVPAVDISGQLADAQIAALDAVKITGQITSTQITDSAITTPKLAAGSVVAGKVAAGAITAGTIAANAVTAGTIAANAVTATTIATNAVTAGKISAGSITAAKLAASSVITLSAQIDDAIITTAKIGDLQVSTLKIAGNAVTVPVYAYTSAGIVIASYQTIQSVSITTSGSVVKLDFSFLLTGNTAGCNFRLTRNGVDVIPASSLSGGSGGLVSFTIGDSPAAGTYTYALLAQASGTTPLALMRSLFAMEIKK
jgi:hypothetical protein